MNKNNPRTQALMYMPVIAGTSYGKIVGRKQ